jgi:hypothetical protein
MEKAESRKKKVKVRKEECVEKLEKHLNFHAKQSDLTHAYDFNMPMILLLYKEAYFNLRISFLKRSLVVCHQFQRLSIKLILC